MRTQQSRGWLPVVRQQEPATEELSQEFQYVLATEEATEKARLAQARRALRPRDSWATPQPLFDKLNAEFNFTIDVCATKENTKCAKFWDEFDDGLTQPWRGEIAWCNPPYSQIGAWCLKAVHATQDTSDTGVVMFLPADTSTRWFHDIVRPTAIGIRMIRGRVQFVPPDEGVKPSSNPWPSMLVVWGRALQQTGNLWRLQP